MKSLQDYSFIFGRAGALPQALPERLVFLGHLVMNPWVLTGIAASFVAMLCWLSALTKFELSYAYPFMSLAFVLVLVLSSMLFNERVTIAKVLGIVMIIAGIVVTSRG
jgi:uncharacterized membrane protein